VCAVGLAEELAQDALVAALEQWPEPGVPDKPGAWLRGTAKHRALDHFRRRKRLEQKQEQLGRELEVQQQANGSPHLAAVLDEQQIGDDLLRLVFIACHPVLSIDARVALCACWAASRRTRSPARSWSASRPSRSASSGPSAPWPRRMSRSSSRPAPSLPRASRPSWRSST
jgi:predicted RNA polymerase sigma factor